MRNKDKKIVDQISHNLDDEFQQIRETLQRHYNPDISIKHLRGLLKQHVPELVESRAQILLDTMLNYQIQDTTKLLENAPTSTKNKFYSLDFRHQFKESFSADSLNFSTDRRLVCGWIVAGCGLVTAGVFLSSLFSGSDLFFNNIFSVLFFSLITLCGSVIAYYWGPRWERTKLVHEVSSYLDRSKIDTKKWLEKVRDKFDSKILEFTIEHNINNKE